MPVSELLASPRNVRRLTWAAALLLVVGVVVFAVTFFGNTAEPLPSSPPADAAPAEPVEAAGPTVPVPPEARTVAGEFILTAVARDDLEKSWELTHPDLRAGYTKEEWAAGNIPIQYYPAGAIDTATFAVDESTEDQVVLQVALLPTDDSEVEGQIFFIGLKKEAVSGEERWLVDYWAPRTIVEVPATGEQ